VGLAIYSSGGLRPLDRTGLGGYFSDNFGWQSIFLLSLPGLVMIAMLCMPRATPRQLHLLAQGDWLGVSRWHGLGCLETVLEEGNKTTVRSPLILRLASSAW